MLTLLISLSGCYNAKETQISEVNRGPTSSVNPIIRKDIFNGATLEYGALTVKEGEFFAESKIIPWSSWWFPANRRYLFDRSDTNNLAPLQKYDLYAKRAHDIDSHSTQFEETDIFNPSEVAWAGLCHAWAVASVIHPEPTTPVTLKNISFTTGDQKALLLKSYENVSSLKIYGQRYDGNRMDEYDDIFPDQFHRIVQVYLFEKGLPFLMDYDPSFSVWTVPVFNIKFIISRDSEGSAMVKSWITLASPFVNNPEFIGTKRIVKYYEYRLYGNWLNGELKVTSSEWINDSRFDHPDYLIGYPSEAKRASLNTQLNNDLIDEIVGKKKI